MFYLGNGGLLPPQRGVAPNQTLRSYGLLDALDRPELIPIAGTTRPITTAGQPQSTGISPLRWRANQVGLLDLLGGMDASPVIGFASQLNGRSPLLPKLQHPRSVPISAREPSDLGLFDQFKAYWQANFPPPPKPEMIDDGKGGIWRKDVYDLIEAIANATPADDGALRKRIQDVLADAPQTRDWWFHYELSNRLAGDDPDTIRASLRDAGNEMSIQAREILPQVLAGIALAGKPILRGSVRQQGDTQPVPTASALTRPGSANGKSSQGLDTSPAAIPIIPANTRGKSNLTKGGLARTASKDWREYRGVFDATGYGGALSAKNRELIAKGRVPIVDEAWVEYHPEDAGLIGEEIQIHHVDGLLPRVPLPYTRHMDAHRPGGPRWNRGGPGSAAPFYPRKRRDE